MSHNSVYRKKYHAKRIYNKVANNETLYNRTITSLNNFINDKTMEYYLANNTPIPFYGSSNIDNSVLFKFSAIENNISYMTSTSQSVNVYDIVEPNWNSLINLSYDLAYTFNDPTGASVTLKYPITIKHLPYNHILTNTEVIDIYGENPGNIYLCNRTAYHSTQNGTYITTAIHKELFDGNKELNGYLIPSDKTKSEYVVNESYNMYAKSLLNAKLYYTVNGTDKISNFAVTYENNNVRQTALYTYTFAPTINWGTEQGVTLDEIKKLFKVESHSGNNRGSKSSKLSKDDKNNNYIKRKLLNNHIIEKTADNRYIYNKINLRNNVDASKRYIKGANQAMEIGPFDVNIIETKNTRLDCFGDVTSYSDVELKLKANDVINTYTLELYTNDTKTFKDGRIKDGALPTNCTIYTHTLKHKLNLFDTNVVYTYYRFNNGLSQIDMTSLYKYDYSIDGSAYQMANLSKDEKTVKHTSISGLTNTVKLPNYTLSYTEKNINTFEQSQNFIINSNISSSVMETTTYICYSQLTNITDGPKIYTYAYAIPQQDPSFTYKPGTDAIKLNITYSIKYIGDYSYNYEYEYDEEKHMVTKYGKLYRYCYVDTIDYNQSKKVNLNYKNAHFLESTDNTGIINDIDVTSYSYMIFKYAPNCAFEYKELTDDNFKIINNNDILYAAHVVIPDADKYIIWTKNNSNQITYYTNGSFIPFDRNSCTLVDSTRLKTVYYKNKGDNTIYSYIIKSPYSSYMDCEGAITTRSDVRFEQTEDLDNAVLHYAYFCNINNTYVRVDTDTMVSYLFSTGYTGKASYTWTNKYVISYCIRHDNSNNYYFSAYFNTYGVLPYKQVKSSQYDLNSNYYSGSEGSGGSGGGGGGGGETDDYTINFRVPRPYANIKAITANGDYNYLEYINDVVYSYNFGKEDKVNTITYAYLSLTKNYTPHIFDNSNILVSNILGNYSTYIMYPITNYEGEYEAAQYEFTYLYPNDTTNKIITITTNNYKGACVKLNKFNDDELLKQIFNGTGRSDMYYTYTLVNNVLPFEDNYQYFAISNDEYENVSTPVHLVCLDKKNIVDDKTLSLRNTLNKNMMSVNGETVGIFTKTQFGNMDIIQSENPNATYLDCFGKFNPN